MSSDFFREIVVETEGGLLLSVPVPCEACQTSTWLYEPTGDVWFKVTCLGCGRLIGYAPATGPEAKTMNDRGGRPDEIRGRAAGD